MIFITGATGFVGGHLARSLVSKGHHVRLLIRDESKIELFENLFSYYNQSFEQFKHQIEFVHGDILDVQSLDKHIDQSIEYVFHCAGLVSFSRTDRKKLVQINKNGTENVVNACLGKNIKKLLYVSSIAALGATNEEFTTELNQKFEIQKSNYYGNSKHLGELEVWRGVEEGLKCIIVYPSVILGPGDWNNGSPQIFKTVFHGMPFYTSGITGYTDVRDLVEIMSKLAFDDFKNEQFIINNENKGYRSIFNEIAKQLNIKAPSKRIHPRILMIAGLLFDFFSYLSGKSLTINSAIARSAFSVTKYDNSKVKNATHCQFRKIENTIEFTSKCFLNDVLVNRKI